MHRIPVVILFLGPGQDVGIENFIVVLERPLLGIESLCLGPVVVVVFWISISVAPSLSFIPPDLNVVRISSKIIVGFEILSVLPFVCRHVLELLERLGIEDIESVFLCPKISGIGAVEEFLKRNISGESLLLVLARSVNEVVEVVLVGRGDAGHRKGEANDLCLVGEAFAVTVCMEISRFEDKPTHHGFHVHFQMFLFETF